MVVSSPNIYFWQQGYFFACILWCLSLIFIIYNYAFLRNKAGSWTVTLYTIWWVCVSCCIRVVYFLYKTLNNLGHLQLWTGAYSHVVVQHFQHIYIIFLFWQTSLSSLSKGYLSSCGLCVALVYSPRVVGYFFLLNQTNFPSPYN
jgi:hypothetical protein